MQQCLILNLYGEIYKVAFAVKRGRDGIIERVDVIDTSDGLPLATISVHTPDSRYLAADEFFLKNYGEATNIVCQLKIQKYIEPVDIVLRSLSVNSTVFAHRLAVKAQNFIIK